MGRVSKRASAAWLLLTAIALLVSACGNDAAADRIPPQIHKIRHVSVVMQENRSFDNYFGTYPGADGIPAAVLHGKDCNPDPKLHTCVRPYHDTHQVDVGGPHTADSAIADVNGGRMNGFVQQLRRAVHGACTHNPDIPDCVLDQRRADVMGYHTAAEIPNYWEYAHHFVLQDHLFSSNLGWSVPAHLSMVSGWSAHCASATNPMSCTSWDGSRAEHLGSHESRPHVGEIRFPWTDLTYLLAQHHVTWRYYVEKGMRPDCPDGTVICPSKAQSPHTPSIWNPLPHFLDVHTDHQAMNVQDSSHFFAAAKAGNLPSVSWIVPSQRTSEHPPAAIWHGQAWVTRIVNSVMQSPDWKSSAIFIAWDDWGGFYDSVAPPQVDSIGYGMRVPGLLISPYARRGFIDHQTLSFDAYLKFIEDDFLGGERIDPATDGRPDSRPDVRENAPQLGDLIKEFDFNQPARPPMLLPPIPNPVRRCAVARDQKCHSTRHRRTRPG